MNKIRTWAKRYKAILTILFICAAFGIYTYKCYTDLYYFKSELYDDAFKGCKTLFDYIPNGSSRLHAEEILINSDGARIEKNNPNSKGIEVGSIIYNLDPWVIFTNDAAYMYVWYDDNNKVIGMTGTNCSNDRYPRREE